MVQKTLFVFLCLLASNALASGRGTCSFSGDVVGTVQNTKSKTNYKIKILSSPQGYCACGVTPAKGDVVSVNFNKKPLLDYIGDPKNKKFSQIIKSHKALLARTKKLAEGYSGVFSASCSDGMTPQGCSGSCGTWLPE